MQATASRQARPERAKTTTLSLDARDKALIARLHSSTGVKRTTDLVRLALRALAKKELGESFDPEAPGGSLTGMDG
jgi:hypothetical protein